MAMLIHHRHLLIVVTAVIWGFYPDNVKAWRLPIPTATTGGFKRFSSRSPQRKLPFTSFTPSRVSEKMSSTQLGVMGISSRSLNDVLTMPDYIDQEQYKMIEMVMNAKKDFQPIKINETAYVEAMMQGGKQ